MSGRITGNGKLHQVEVYVADISVEVLTQVKNKITITTGKILSSDELAEEFNIPKRKLTAYFSFAFKIEIKEYTSYSKYFQLRNIILENNIRHTGELLAGKLGYSNASGVHYLVKKMTGLTLNEFIKKTREYCGIVCRNNCEKEFEHYFKPVIKL